MRKIDLAAPQAAYDAILGGTGQMHLQAPRQLPLMPPRSRW